MNDSEIIEQLRAEAETHTPDLSFDPRGAVQMGAAEAEILAVPHRRWLLPVAAALLSVILFLAILLPLVFSRGETTLVISINPSAEFLIEKGKVKRARALNQDAAVMLVGEDLVGMTAEEACVTFATLARGKNLITANGIRIRVTGKDRDRIAGSVQTALKDFTVGDLADEDLDSILGGYNEAEMQDFEDYLINKYAASREAFMRDVEALLQTYEEDLIALDFSDSAAVEAFNRKYMLLDDLCIERGEEKEEYFEEYRELKEEIEEDPDEAFEDLFEDFLEIFEEDYAHGGSGWREHDD